MVRIRTLALFASLAALACGNSSPSPSPTGDGGTTAAWNALVGDQGLVAQTFNGQTWTTRTIGNTALYAVGCVDNQHGWVAGASGYVAYTSDGGAAWAAQASTLSANLYAVRFASLSHGVVAGAGGALAVTGDGGATWRAVPLETTVSFRAAAAASAPDLFIIAGDGGTLLRSTDDGVTWTAGAIATSANLHGVDIDDAGKIAYAVDVAGNVWRSTDGAASFTLDAALGPSFDAVSVSDDGARAIAAGAGGAVFVRSASGWARAVVPTTVNLHAALAFDGMALAAGDQGTLLASTDGIHFAVVPLATTSTIRALDDF